jgi:hypothetical protein
MNLWQKLVLAVIGLAVSVGSVEAQTTLRMKFQAGDKLGYVLDQKMKMFTNFMGKDTDVNSDQTMNMTWQVLKVDKSGAGEIKVAFTGVKMVMNGPMGKVEVDSKNPNATADPLGKVLAQIVGTIAGMEMTTTMEPTGEVKEVNVPLKVKGDIKNLPGMGELFSDDNLKTMVLGGMVLPKEAVTVGKTWSRKTDLKIPLGRLKADILFTYEGTVDMDGKKLEKIAIKPTMSFETNAAAPFKVKEKSQEGKGTMYFDNAAGRMVEINASQSLEMTVEANNMTVKVEQSTTMKLAK